MRLDQRLRHHRQMAELTGVAAARRVGVSEQVLYRWENGHSEPRLRTAMRLAQVYGVSLDELVGLSHVSQSATDDTEKGE